MTPDAGDDPTAGITPITRMPAVVFARHDISSDIPP